MAFPAIKNANGRHLYALASGLALLLYAYGLGVLHAWFMLATALGAFYLAPRRAGWIAWATVLPALIYYHVSSNSSEAWKRGEIKVTGSLAILTLKLIALCVARQDGATQGVALKEYTYPGYSGLVYSTMNYNLAYKTLKQEEREYARMHRISGSPPLLEVLAYCCMGGSLLVGPFFEFTEYRAFAQRSGPWSAKARRPPPSPLLPGLLELGKALLLLAALLPALAYMPEDFLALADRLPAMTLPARYLSVHCLVQVVRLRFYFAWTLSNAAMILSGLGFSRWDLRRVQDKHPSKMQQGD